MLFTPNKINWGTCPYCQTILNGWDGVPAEAVGSAYLQSWQCASPKCGQWLEGRVKVTFEFELYKSEES